MSDSLIHETASQTNAVFAYGERPKRRLILGVLFGVVALAIMIALSAWMFVRQPLPLPTRTAWLAYVPSSLALSNEAFQPWRSLDGGASFGPVFIGSAIDEEGRDYPFLVRLRMSAGNGIWMLATDASVSEYITLTPEKINFTWSDWFSPAWLRMWPSVALGASGGEFDVDFSLSGRLTSQGWMTNAAFALPESSSVAEIDGPNFLDLEALPQARPFVEAALQQYGVDTGLIDAPSRLIWDTQKLIPTSSTEMNLAVDFSAPVSSSTILAIAAARGEFDREWWSLPDETVVRELRLPEQILADATSSPAWIQHEGRRLVLGDVLWNPAKIKLPAFCHGRIIAVLDREALQPLFAQTPFVMSEKMSDFQINRLIFSVVEGKLRICW